MINIVFLLNEHSSFVRQTNKTQTKDEWDTNAGRITCIVETVNCSTEKNNVSS
ncbi:hypothetical protein JCM6294_2500 [Bacteroides pyogenes DSM 20611 = JCM 6294]|uniref:Uncharacterized protein n=1 Tax=Bacteroides pyogenes DSM 20611 = JCM 6294 TaxID=1121100 RepID=W4PI30_9BACE|nr:hypothetical protein JCM6294_2500 [Bacteroides pyogenes DSM 20611 = JCM 6294]